MGDGYTRRVAEIELNERKSSATGKKFFKAILSTEAPVRRRNYQGHFFEVLSHKEGAVDLSRAPLPLLESHDQRNMPVGIVDNLRIVDGKLRGDATFGSSPRAQEIAADVEGGVIRNLSIGYSIDEVEERDDGNQKTLTAVRWTPHEVSAVAVGADAGAGFNRSFVMETETSEEQPQMQTREAEVIERERCSGILRAARALGMNEEAEELIREGVPLDAARARLIDKRGESASQIEQGGGVHVRASFGSGSGEEFRTAASDALLLRSGIQPAKVHPAARDISASVVDLARTCLSRAGKTTSFSRSEPLIRSAMSTSDFPAILANAIHKGTLRGYEDEPASHRLWVRTQSVKDFREQHRVILGSAPELEHVNEGGEYRQGNLDEDSTSYKVAKFGRLVALTWEVLVNDDLDAFMRIQPAMGQAARRKEADVVYSLLAENTGSGPIMQDGIMLFNANHGNIASNGGAGLDSALLGSARALLRKQTALGGGHLSLVPRTLLVPAELETEAEMLLAQATRHTTTTGAGTTSAIEASTPKWLSGLQLVVEPRLPDDAMYLVAGSSQIDTVELGLLEENMGGPTLAEDEGFVRDIIRWKVRHVFGAKFLDWRGIVKLPIV